MLPSLLFSWHLAECAVRDDMLAYGHMFLHACARHTLQQENERLRMSAVRRDLDSCYSTLQQRESDLQIRIKALSRQAVSYKQVGTCSCCMSKQAKGLIEHAVYRFCLCDGHVSGWFEHSFSLCCTLHI